MIFFPRVIILCSFVVVYLYLPVFNTFVLNCLWFFLKVVTCSANEIEMNVLSRVINELKKVFPFSFVLYFSDKQTNKSTLSYFTVFQTTIVSLLSI